MARKVVEVYTCDRCRCEIDYKKHGDKLFDLKWMRTFTNSSRSGSGNGNGFDLCSKCTEDFFTFWRMK